MSVISTPLTEMFKIQHPILLAGMNVAAGPELAAAVTNAGGLGVIGGLGYTPKTLKAQVRASRSSQYLCASDERTDRRIEEGPQGQECAVWC